MYTYTFLQWLLLFYIYCFIGWCIESTIVSIENRKLINRGFLRSPMLPIYGFGAIVILFISLPFKENPVLVYLSGTTGTTLLEFLTGWLMERLFKMKYWDYSDNKYNIKGYICLTSSLFWGVLSLFLVYMLHCFVEKIILSIPTIYAIIADTIITTVFIADLIYAVRTALDVNKILESITQIKKEIIEANQQLTQRIEESETTARINAKLESLRTDYTNIKEKLGFFKKDFILAHPTARSRKFDDALKELREHLKNKIK